MNSGDVITGYLWFFGAVLIPAIYLVCTRFRGALKRRMLVGLALQVVCSLALVALFYPYLATGYSGEAAWFGEALLLFVNFCGLIYYLSVLLFSRRSKPINPLQPTREDARG